MNEKSVISADVVAGTQMALVAAIAALLQYASRQDERVRIDFEHVVEHTKARLLASTSSQEKLDAFESVAQSLLNVL